MYKMICLACFYFKFSHCPPPSHVATSGSAPKDFAIRITLVPTRYFERMVHTPLLKLFDQENVLSEGQCDIVSYRSADSLAVFKLRNDWLVSRNN